MKVDYPSIILMIFQFILSCNLILFKVEFIQEMGRFCPYCNATFNNMEEAKEACRPDDKCGIIYDLFCDGEGYFCICPSEALIKQTHRDGIDCIYKK